MAYATWDEVCHEILWHPEQPLLDAHATLVGDAGYRAEQRGDVVFTDETMPSREEALAVYQDPATGKPTPFEKFARTTLPKSSIFYASCFDPTKPLAPLAGQRYTRLRSAVAWASNYLVQPDSGVTPLHLFGLFVLSAEQWGEDDDGTPFVERLWTFCQYFHALDVARVRQQTLDAQVAAQETHSVLEQMLDRVAEWAPHVRDLDPKAQRRWLLRRLVVSLGASTNYYVMDTTGQYNPVAVIAPKLPSTMAMLGLGSIVKLRNDEGKWVPPTDVLNSHSTVVAHLRYETGNVRARIEHEGTPGATLIFGSYARRDDLEPEWSDDVDGWLEALAGPRYYETLCEWLGHAPAFDEGGLPMLSLAGPPDIGKNLLVLGLAEVLQQPVAADAEALFGNWNEQLLKTPIVHIDEGFGVRHMKHPADRLREAIGSQAIPIRRRFSDTGLLRTNLRVILTANDANVLAKLAVGNDLNEYAQNALTERVIHINGRQEAADYIAKRGGVKFTRGWIRGEGGQPSRFVLAKHILKLHEMTAASRQNRTTRLLMSGIDEKHRDVDTERTRRLRTGATPTAAMALFRMLNVIGDPKKQGNRYDKLWIDEERQTVWILAGAITEYLRTDDFFSPKDWLGTAQVAAAVKNLSRPLEEDLLKAVTKNTAGRVTLHARKQLGAQFWKPLDVEALLDLSRLEGYPVPILERLVEGASVMPIEAAPKVSTNATTNVFSSCRA